MAFLRNGLRCSASWGKENSRAHRTYELDLALLELSRERTIKLRAYGLWEKRGRPLLDDWTDWFLAEREIGTSK
ncbi:MAG: DUF2934 domain-containing protein [Isosphaeraceae bacterium]